jgi:hypothetical protein
MGAKAPQYPNEDEGYRPPNPPPAPPKRACRHDDHATASEAARSLGRFLLGKFPHFRVKERHRFGGPCSLEVFSDGYPGEGVIPGEWRGFRVDFVQYSVMVPLESPGR